MKQGELTIAQYYAKLSGLQPELDFYQNFLASCLDDGVKFQKLVEQEQIYDFLVGLNVKYDQIRVQVLGKDHLSTLRRTYSYVQQEESRRSAMIHSMSVDKAGLAANFSREQSHGSLDKDQLHCDYCGKNRHTKEHCWKLHGRPSKGHGGKRMGSARL